MICTISRAAWLASNQQQPTLLQALTIPPLRLLAVCVFSIINYIVVNIVSSLLFLPFSFLFFFLSLLLGASVSFIDPTTNGPSIFRLIVGFLAGLAFFAITVFSVIASVGTIQALIYSLQGLIHPSSSFGERFRHAFAIFFHNFGRNIVVFLTAGSLVLVLSASIALSLGTILHYPIELLNPSKYTSAQISFFASLILSGLLLMPIMPIIATVLYKHNSYEYDAGELSARFEQLAFVSQQTVDLRQRV